MKLTLTTNDGEVLDSVGIDTESWRMAIDNGLLARTIIASMFIPKGFEEKEPEE